MSGLHHDSVILLAKEQAIVMFFCDGAFNCLSFTAATACNSWSARCLMFGLHHDSVILLAKEQATAMFFVTGPSLACLSQRLLLATPDQQDV